PSIHFPRQSPSHKRNKAPERAGRDYAAGAERRTRSMTRSVYVNMFTGAALATMMIMAPSAMASPGAVTPSPAPSANSQVPVQQGTDVASLARATAFGDAPPGNPETVSFILRERNLPQLKAAVQHGVRNFLSVGQFAAPYGQTQANIPRLPGSP